MQERFDEYLVTCTLYSQFIENSTSSCNQTWNKWCRNYFPFWNCVHRIRTSTIILEASVLHVWKWLEFGLTHFSQCNINLVMFCYIQGPLHKLANGRRPMRNWVDTFPTFAVLTVMSPSQALAGTLLCPGAFTVGYTVRNVSILF